MHCYVERMCKTTDKHNKSYLSLEVFLFQRKDLVSGKKQAFYKMYSFFYKNTLYKNTEAQIG